METDSESSQANYQLGISLFRQGKHDAAIEPLKLAIEANPNLTDVYICLSNIYNHKGLIGESMKILEAAHQAMPGNLDMICLLAEAKEKANAIDDAKRLAETALELSPTHPVANIVAARLDIRSGDMLSAIDKLSRLVETGNLGETNFSNSQYLLGKAYDRTGKYSEAFSAFELANKSASSAYGNTFKGGLMLDRIYRYKGAIKKDNTRKWNKGWAPTQEPDPVFLVAFPRSGTTLTENMLASHPDIVTSDERPFLLGACEPLTSTAKAAAGFPYTLDTLSRGEVLQFNRRYHELVHASVNTDLHGKIFIDKLPLNIIEVGLIKRIFRNPRFILLLRDPRDVCLSCFMQSFIPNHAMANFLTLEKTARFYAATMDLWLHYRKVFDLNVHTLKYEDLVSDTRSEAGKLLEFLGLKWNDNLLDHDKRNQRVVATPSYQDITSPIYKRSVERWRNYEERFADLHDVLEPYLNEYGY